MQKLQCFPKLRFRLYEDTLEPIGGGLQLCVHENSKTGRAEGYRLVRHLTVIRRTESCPTLIVGEPEDADVVGLIERFPCLQARACSHY
jgi:hypothetical protein